MAGKRPIDIKRSSGGGFTIGDESDGTPISEMFTMNDGLIIITKKATYEVKLADQIDPERTNLNLPKNVQRRMLNIGSDSELIGRILLTAKNLFREHFLPTAIDHKHALVLSFEALTEILAMQNTASEYELAEKQAIEVAANRKQNDGSMAIPSVGDVKTRCKTFFQKADHTTQILLSIVKMFYPTIGRRGFQSLADLVQTRYGEADDFTKMITQALPFLKMVRNTRDCLDHRNIKGVVITDFVLRPEGTIDLPTIAIEFRDTAQPPVALSVYKMKIVESMINAFESLIAFLCSKQVQPYGGLPVQVGLIPEN